MSACLPYLPRCTARLAVALALLVPAAARAQDRERDRDRDRDRDRATYRIDTTVAVGRDASVDLSLVSGDVTVTASDRAEIRVRASSETIPLRFEHFGNSVRVTTESGRYRRSGEQRMEVVVPVGTRVRAGSVSGSVSVRGVRGEVEASSVSGTVTVENVVRRAALSSVSGSVRAREIDGDVRARGVSGDIRLERIAGEVDAETVSGDVEVRRARSGRVHAQSVSGELTYEGTIDREGRYDFQSHSGTVRLLVPENAGISLGASTYSGSVNSRLQATLGPTRTSGGTRRGQRMDLTINGGGARVTAQSFSGDIVIDRATGRPDSD